MKRLMELAGAAIIGGVTVAAVAFGVSQARAAQAPSQLSAPQEVSAPSSMDSVASVDAMMLEYEAQADQGGGQGGCAGEIDPELRESLRAATQTALAQALGMTEDELKAAHDAGKTLDDLATEKGVDMETIRSAVEAARKTVLDAAVAAGTITQEQADFLLTARPHRPGNGGPNGNGGPDVQIDPEVRESIHAAVDAAVAEALGISVEELEAARQAGTKLEELATEKGVDIETVREAAEAARTAAINQAVTDGKLTQEEATALLNAPHRPGNRPGGPGNGPNGGGTPPDAPEGQPAP